MDKLDIFFLYFDLPVPSMFPEPNQFPICRYAAIKTGLAGAKLERDALADSLNESRAALSSVHSERDALATNLREERSALRRLKKVRGYVLPLSLSLFSIVLTPSPPRRFTLSTLSPRQFQFPPMDTKSPPTGAETKALLLSRQSWEKYARETLADAESAHAEVEALRVVVAEGQDREARLRRELQHQWENVAAHLVI